MADDHAKPTPHDQLIQQLNEHFSWFVRDASSRGNRADAEDIVQEAFTRLYTRLLDGLRFESFEKSFGWMRVVIRREVWRQGRQRNRRVRVEYCDPATIPEPEIEPRSAEHPAAEFFPEALARLPVVQQTVLRLRFGNGWQEAAIAERIGRSQGTVSRLLSKAQERLRREIARLRAASRRFR